jgi:hypothetical protein
VVLVSRCDPNIADLIPPDGRQLDILSGHCPRPAGCSFPFLPFQYTAKRQDEIFARHSRKKTGRRLLAIWAAIVGIFYLEVLLMVLSGLWSIELR